VFDRGDLSASDDYLNEFLRQTDQYFGELGVPLDLVVEETFEGEPILYNLTETGKTLLHIEDTIREHPYIRGYTFISWYHTFLDFAAEDFRTRNRLDEEGFPYPEEFNYCLNAWLTPPIEAGAYFQVLLLSLSLSLFLSIIFLSFRPFLGHAILS